MRWSLFPLLLIASPVCVHARSCAHDDWSMNNHWLVTGDCVYLRRAEIHSKSLVKKEVCQTPSSPSSPSVCTSNKVLSSERLQQEFDFEPGFRVGLSCMIDKCSTFEGNYLQIKEWEAQRCVKGNSNLFFPFENSNYTNDFFDADAVDATYQSRYCSAEVNYWRHLSPRRENYFSFSWIAGLRYMNIKETSKLAFTKRADKSDFDVRTQNHLYGVQLGADLQMNPMRCLSWDFLAKVGACLNHASLKDFLGDNNNTTVLRNTSSRGDWGAFFTEVYAILTYQLSRYLNVHAGYQMIFLSGLVLAPEHMDRDTCPSSGREFEANGEAILHGFYGGISIGF